MPRVVPLLLHCRNFDLVAAVTRGAPLQSISATERGTSAQLYEFGDKSPASAL